MAITSGYATLAEIKALVGVTAATHEADLERAVEAASRRIDGWCGRYFYQDASTSAREYTPDDDLVLAGDDISTATGLTVYPETVFGTWGQLWTKDDWTGDYGFRCEPDDAPFWRLIALSGSWQMTR